MISGSLVEQIKCRWREFLREPSAFFWVILMPVIWMLILGFAFSNPKPETYTVGWLEENAASPFAKEAQDALTKNPQVKMRVAGEDTLTTLFVRGEISLILKMTEEGGGVTYFLDKANPEAMRARDFVDKQIQTLAGRADPVETATETLTAQGGRYVDFLIPGLLGLTIMTTSLFGTGMTIVSNRKENLLKRYLATPMKPGDYVVSHIVGRYITLATEFGAVMLAGYFIFKFHVYGNMVSFVIITLLGAASFTAIAMLCASRTKSIPMVSGLTNLISLPMMILSGVFFSKNNFPDWLRSVVEYLPLTALNDALRKIALEGQTLAMVSGEMVVLAAYAVVPTVLAAKLFKWY